MTVSWSNLILIPMVFNLVAVIVCGLYYALRSASRQVRFTHERIYRCSVCDRVYVDHRDVPLAGCPRCGSLNESVTH
jgi:protein-arginine kinase activator protein McsA